MRGFCVLLGAVAFVRGAQIPALVSTTVGRTTGWGYKTNGADVLPAAWKDFAGSAQCGVAGKQSPIDIVVKSLEVATTDPGNITGVAYDQDIMGTWINDGRSLTYQITSPIKPYIMGGALTAKKTYVFDHADLHFGSVSTQGSEHTIDAVKSPMELHLVHYDSSLLTEAGAAASTNADALTVVAFLFEIDTVDNADLSLSAANILALTTELVPGTKVVSVAANLMKLIGDTNIEEYYSYDGSLTVPVCTENTKWIISPKKLKVSEAQLVALRTLLDVDTKAVSDNFRPVQAIGTRKVMHRAKPAVKKSEAVGQAATILGSTLLGIGTFGAVYNILTQDGTAKALKSNPILDLIEDAEKLFRGEDEADQHHHEHAQHEQQFQGQQFQQPQQFQQRYR